MFLGLSEWICSDTFLFLRSIVLSVLKDPMLGDASHENSEEEIVLDDTDKAVEVTLGVRGELRGAVEMDPLSPWPA